MSMSEATATEDGEVRGRHGDQEAAGDEQGRPAVDEARRQGRQERVDLEGHDDEAVAQSQGHAHEGRTEEPYVGVHVHGQPGRRHARDTDDGARREVEASADAVQDPYHVRSCRAT